MPKFKNGEDFYNRIYLIFNGLIAISLLPFSLVFLDIQKNGPENAIIKGIEANGLVFIVIIVISFFAYRSFQDLKVFKKNLNVTNELRHKLIQYYSTFLKHYMVLSLFGLIIALALYLTRMNLLIISYIIILVLLSINRPTLKSIVALLRLSKEEQDILYKKLDIS